MKKLILMCLAPCIAIASFAGFNPKVIKPKQPEKFQTRTTVSGVTIAADLLLADKEQTEFFAKALNPSNIIALRLAIFNNSPNEVLIPVEGIQLLAPDGKEIPLVSPEAVAQAVLQGIPTEAKTKESPATVDAGPTTANPRIDTRSDKTSPNYDPRLDPTDPRYDPSDPRNRGYNNRRIVPGVAVVLNPPGTSTRRVNSDEISRALIEKDFSDKAYIADPIMASMKKDRFLYFSMADRPAGIKGFELRLPEGKGISQSVRLKF